jgi:hypothetical protein
MSVSSCAASETVIIFYQLTFPFTRLPTTTTTTTTYLHPSHPLARKGPHRTHSRDQAQVRTRSFLLPADKHNLITIGGQSPNWRLFAVKYLLSQIRPALPVTRPCQAKPSRDLSAGAVRRVVIVCGERTPPAYSSLDAYAYRDGVHLAEVITEVLERGAIPATAVTMNRSRRSRRRRESVS